METTEHEWRNGGTVGSSSGDGNNWLTAQGQHCARCGAERTVYSYADRDAHYTSPELAGRMVAGCITGTTSRLRDYVAAIVDGAGDDPDDIRDDLLSIGVDAVTIDDLDDQAAALRPGPDYAADRERIYRQVAN